MRYETVRLFLAFVTPILFPVHKRLGLWIKNCEYTRNSKNSFLLRDCLHFMQWMEWCPSDLNASRTVSRPKPEALRTRPRPQPLRPKQSKFGLKSGLMTSTSVSLILAAGHWSDL